MSNTNTLSGFTLSLASLYRDVQVAKNQSELNAMTDVSAPGAEKVPDTEAAIGYTGRFAEAAQTVRDNSGSFMLLAVAVVAVGAVVALSR